MPPPRIITKYPNRRLYDTVRSCYITLADIRELVMKRIDFVVIDNGSRADLTSNVLLQLIVERELAGKLRIRPEFLRKLIRSRGRSMARRAASLNRARSR